MISNNFQLDFGNWPPSLPRSIRHPRPRNASVIGSAGLKLKGKFLTYNRLSSSLHEWCRRLHERGNGIHERMFFCKGKKAIAIVCGKEYICERKSL